MFSFPISFFSLSATSNVINLVYLSNGDTNGLIYYLGTNQLTTSFSNPDTLNLVAVSSTTPGTNDSFNTLPANSVTDRTDNTWVTDNVSERWLRLSLNNHLLKINRYNIKTKNDSVNRQIRNWKLQGSNNVAVWTDLDTKVNQTTINSSNTWYTFPITTTEYYRFIRIIETGVNSSGTNALSFNEIEFYGELIPYTGVPNTTTIAFDSLGGNDIFYYLGTNQLTTAFVNPLYTYINVLISGLGSGNISLLTDRTNNNFATTNTANSFVTFDFLINKVKPTDYVLQARNTTNNYIRNWKLQGSNTGTTWTDLDTRTSNTSINAANARARFTCVATEYYRFVRLLQTGVNSNGTNSLTLGEFYIYGDLLYQ